MKDPWKDLGAEEGNWNQIWMHMGEMGEWSRNEGMESVMGMHFMMQG